MPDPTAGHDKRIYDQIFLDGTHTAGGCLIIAATIEHVTAWHWCKHETTRDYQRLLKRIEAPLIASIDGGQGAYSAIKKCWPTTKIQRCLVHAQRVVHRYTTSQPRTDAGRTIYTLALKLTRITTLDEAAAWGAQLHEFSTIYQGWMNEKTLIKDPCCRLPAVRLGSCWTMTRAFPTALAAAPSTPATIPLPIVGTASTNVCTGSLIC